MPAAAPLPGPQRDGAMSAGSPRPAVHARAASKCLPAPFSPISATTSPAAPRSDGRQRQHAGEALVDTARLSNGAGIGSLLPGLLLEMSCNSATRRLADLARRDAARSFGSSASRFCGSGSAAARPAAAASGAHSKGSAPGAVAWRRGCPAASLRPRQRRSTVQALLTARPEHGGCIEQTDHGWRRASAQRASAGLAAGDRTGR